MKKFDNMVDFGGHLFYIDLKALDKTVVTDESLKAQDLIEEETIVHYDKDDQITSKMVTTKKYPKGKEADGVIYDSLRLALEVVMTAHDEIDGSLGLDRGLQNMSLPFKIAFNTLLIYGILAEADE